DNTGGIVGLANNDIMISNVSFEGEVFGNQYVGGLIGSSYLNSDAQAISNCNVNANITTASNNAGGLIGYANHTNIINSNATGEVKSTYSSSRAIGGLVGFMYGTNAIIFDKNFASSIVSGYSQVGGLIGSSSLINIKNSFADSAVIGTESVGGLIGYINIGIVSDSYAQGAIQGDHYIGGLLGYADGNSPITVTNTYAAALVSGVVYAGGLIGYKVGTVNVNNSYWDRDVSGQPYSSGGTPKTTAEMYQQATYVNWNFNTIWQIDEDVNYPHLRVALIEE
ncbi:MAG: GLUG motif-containing protein, partial [Gammaproteobacteria bacterium]